MAVLCAPLVLLAALGFATPPWLLAKAFLPAFAATAEVALPAAVLAVTTIITVVFRALFQALGLALEVVLVAAAASPDELEALALRLAVVPAPDPRLAGSWVCWQLTNRLVVARFVTALVIGLLAELLEPPVVDTLVPAALLAPTAAVRATTTVITQPTTDCQGQEGRQKDQEALHHAWSKFFLNF